MLQKFFHGRLLATRLAMLLAVLALTTLGIAVIYAAAHPAPDIQYIDYDSILPNTLTDDAAPGIPANPVSPAEAGNQQPNAGPNPDGSTAAPSTIAPREHRFAADHRSDWKKQLLFSILALAALTAVTFFDYRRLGPFSYALYGLGLFLLALLIVAKILRSRFGIEIPFIEPRNGAYCWIQFKVGGSTLFQVQPSEFTKIAFILALAYYLQFRKNYRTLIGLVGPFALTLLAMVLILLEPDLGTVILMMPILFAMLFAAGAKAKHLILILCLAALSSPFLWLFMKDYQRMRVSSVLLQNPRVYQAAHDNPRLARLLVGKPERIYEWRRNQGYQLLHSKQAVASGGLTGYGFARGPYLQDDFFTLPEKHNDFIFSIIAHQFGLLGCAVTLGLYGVLIAAGLQIAHRNTDPFGRLVAVGVTSMFAFQTLITTSMTLGLMPITGLTLPFVSYGGSSLISSFIALGLLNSIGKHRPFSVAKKPFEFSKADDLMIYK